LKTQQNGTARPSSNFNSKYTTNQSSSKGGTIDLNQDGSSGGGASGLRNSHSQSKNVKRASGNKKRPENSSSGRNIPNAVNPSYQDNKFVSQQFHQQ
jgi:hypothetical protein